MYVVTHDTPISALTVQQFRELFFNEKKPSEQHHFPPIFGIKVCKEVTGYSLAAIYQRTSKNLIPHFRRDGRVLFKREEIYEWMTENKVKTQDEFAQELDIKLTSKKSRK